ncbi:hypothetical protein Tco_0065277 [Tanacetum coccineum]
MDLDFVADGNLRELSGEEAWEVPSFDGPESQPLLNSLSLDVSPGDIIGPEPPINLHSPDSSRMKGSSSVLMESESQPLLNSPSLDVVDYLTTQTPPSPHMSNSSIPKGVYSPVDVDDDRGLESMKFLHLGEEPLYLMRRSLEVLRKFHWMILGGRFNQLSHVSSPLLSKPGEY